MGSEDRLRAFRHKPLAGIGRWGDADGNVTDPRDADIPLQQGLLLLASQPEACNDAS